MPIQDLTFNAAHLGCTRDEQLLFKPISFVLKSGMALIIEGPNGIGKTTLLRVLAGLLTPACGSVSKIKNLAYLGPHNAVKGLLTPVEYLKYFTSAQPSSLQGPSSPRMRGSILRSIIDGLWNMDPRIRGDDGLCGDDGPCEDDSCAVGNEFISVQSTLEQLQLKGLENKPCASLSSGQKQRVALARIVLSYADLWILDEPLTALDKQGELIFSALLDTHLTQGGIAVIATHQALNNNNLQKIILEP